MVSYVADVCTVPGQHTDSGRIGAAPQWRFGNCMLTKFGNCTKS
jgi:hypothetical protein